MYIHKTYILYGDNVNACSSDIHCIYSRYFIQYVLALKLLYNLAQPFERQSARRPRPSIFTTVLSLFEGWQNLNLSTFNKGASKQRYSDVKKNWRGLISGILRRFQNHWKGSQKRQIRKDYVKHYMYCKKHIYMLYVQHVAEIGTDVIDVVIHKLYWKALQKTLYKEDCVPPRNAVMSIQILLETCSTVYT